ncbi:MAG: tetratricopeptide repeat protein [Rhodospirillales bacterium]|jgi:Flp pilus assembly protein TadD|nr:tetratricopeptide repeat protein [Rhodospirillales bacterium]MDP6774454.1 tetratricopeptide repeat protein [Rhodospirillales bacterium]
MKNARNRMGHPFTAVAFALVLLAAACGAPVPTKTEMVEDNRLSRADQIMRVANATRRGGDLHSAMALFRRAHNMDRTSAAPLIALGETAYAAEAYQESAEAYRDAITLAPEDAAARLGYGKTLIALGLPRQAAAQFRRALDVDAKNPQASSGLGVALDLMGDHRGAQERYKAAIKMAPEVLSLRNNLAMSLALSGDYDAAIRHLAEIAGDPAATARTRQNLALVYGLAGEVGKAAEIGRLDLDEAEVRNNLAYYARLRALSPAARSAAILGRGGDTSE